MFYTKIQEKKTGKNFPEVGIAKRLEKHIQKKEN